MAKMKVFRGLVFRGRRQVRTIVAAPSQAAAARAVHETLHRVREWWHVTSNNVELATALAKPGQVFMASDRMAKYFRPVIYLEGAWIDANATESERNRDDS